MERNDDQNPFEIGNDLWAEWERQPGLMRSAGRREADARHEHAQAKARLAVCAAALKLSMRKNPGKYDLRDKPTADEIECALELQKEYQKAVEAVNVSKRDLDYASADTTAFVDRRKSLENRVELLALEYHSEKEPRMPASEKAREKMADRRLQSIRRGDGDGA